MVFLRATVDDTHFDPAVTFGVVPGLREVGLLHGPHILKKRIVYSGSIKFYQVIWFYKVDKGAIFQLIDLVFNRFAILDCECFDAFSEITLLSYSK